MAVESLRKRHGDLGHAKRAVEDPDQVEVRGEPGLSLLLVGDPEALRLRPPVRGGPGLAAPSVGERLRGFLRLRPVRSRAVRRHAVPVPVRLDGLRGLQDLDRRVAQLGDPVFDHLRGHIIRHLEIERLRHLPLPRSELKRDAAPVARLGREARRSTAVAGVIAAVGRQGRGVGLCPLL